MEEIWTQLDLEASKQQQRTYIDPQSGYRVFTTYGLLQRKNCCGCGCRHCPFGHREVSDEYRQKSVKTLGLKETLEIVTLLMLSLGAVVRIVI